ncbi:hypothetical protein ABW20_dc0110192 [Dactylellina cionopaga]|nr:hypothetical protein ABW20_dc0110192 [Dactylellina cionopaga]
MGSLAETIPEGLSDYTEAYLIFNTSGTRDDFQSTTTPPDSWEQEEYEAWTRLTTPSGRSSISASLCFINPLPFNYAVEAWADGDATEPTLGWNETSGEYITDDILELLGATYPQLSPKERHILELKPRLNWTAFETEEAYGATSTVNFIWSALNRVYGVEIPLTNTAVDLTPSSSFHSIDIHRAHIVIFQNILKTTGSPALALQGLFTVLTQVAYYDFIAQFDVSAPSETVFSAKVTIPLRWNGILVVCGTLMLHLLLLTLTAILFLKKTSLSLIGNSWQAVSQVVSADTQLIISRSSDMTDRQVRHWLEQSDAVPRTIVISARGSTGRSEAVFR